MMEDQNFININFKETAVDTDGYEKCIFTNCNFEDVNLSMIKFVDCVFNGCNLSLARFGQTVFRDVQFTGCKMLGLHFEHCSEYGISAGFDDCTLNDCCFFKTKIKKTVFKNCRLHNTDFSEADLSEAVLTDNDCKGAIFVQTNLEKADLTGSFNYMIDPSINKIKKAKFSLQGLPGLLTKYDIKIER